MYLLIFILGKVNSIGRPQLLALLSGFSCTVVVRKTSRRYRNCVAFKHFLSNFMANGTNERCLHAN